VIQGEFALAQKEAAPTAQQSRPLMPMLGAAAVPAGGELLARAADKIAQVVENWLAQPPGRTRSAASKASLVTRGRVTRCRRRQTRRCRRGR
jgi:hypothetical protein